MFDDNFLQVAPSLLLASSPLLLLLLLLLSPLLFILRLSLLLKFLALNNKCNSLNLHFYNDFTLVTKSIYQRSSAHTRSDIRTRKKKKKNSANWRHYYDATSVSTSDRPTVAIRPSVGVVSKPYFV